MCARGDGAVFSDFEGEVLYCLLRELRPETFFEISPDCGYSTISPNPQHRLRHSSAGARSPREVSAARSQQAYRALRPGGLLIAERVCSARRTSSLPTATASS